MNSGRFGTPKPDRFGLSDNANKCSNAGAGGHGGLTTHELSAMAGSVECVYSHQAKFRSGSSICSHRLARVADELGASSKRGQPRLRQT